MTALERLDGLVDWRATIAWGDYHGDKQPIRGTTRFRAVDITIVDGEGKSRWSTGYGASFLEALENAATAMLEGVYESA